MKFDGNNWVNVGTAGFSVGEAFSTSLAFSPSGEPYVAYQDSANSYKATVMTFNGTNWVDVGNAGFSSGEADFTSLAFSPSGLPYVAYPDGGNSQKATVMYYDAPAGISELQSQQITIYPNPASDFITLNINNKNAADVTLTIYTSIGTLVKSELVRENTQKIYVGDLSCEVYIIALKSKDLTENRELIVQR
jgi:hypothetical protein